MDEIDTGTKKSGTSGVELFEITVHKNTWRHHHFINIIDIGTFETCNKVAIRKNPELSLVVIIVHKKREQKQVGGQNIAIILFSPLERIKQIPEQIKIISRKDTTKW